MRAVRTPESESPASPAPARPLRILYADDMPELRDLMSELLGRDGHNIETVDDGGEALERLKEALSAFDLLITDHHMPGLNGLELVRQSRQLPYPGKIVVFSSELSEEVNNQYRKFAVDAILPKPVSPRTFRTVIGQLFAAEKAPEGAAAPLPPGRG